MSATSENRRRKGHCLVAAGCLGLVLLVVLVVVAVAGWFLFGPTIEDFRHRRDFDADLWRDQQAAQCDTMWPPRLCMVDDLMASGRLDGLTKDEVLAMLGQPEEKDFPAGAADCDIHYFLGPERGLFRIDSEWLFISFGDDGRVERCWLYTD